MTSLEIAELTVMEAIRKMEPAWEKICKSKFRLTSRIVEQPNGGTREVPCYSLTKTECLYIATKFNDEAHARCRCTSSTPPTASPFPTARRLT